MDRMQKADRVEVLKEKFAKAQAAVVVDYTGTSVQKITDIRDRLREVEVEYYVVKNTLARLAMDGNSIGLLKDMFKGPTAIALSFDDPAAPAKVLTKIAKEVETIKFKGAMVDGQSFGPEAIDSLSKLPSKDDIRARLLATLLAPATNLVGVLSAPLREMVQVLSAYHDKQANPEQNG